MARSLVRFDPFAELSALTREMFEGGSMRAGQSRMPTTDIYTEKDALVVEAHLPNFGEDDVSVDVDRGALVIHAERREREEDKDKKYVVRESATSFYRSVLLPDEADESKITASFTQGVLTVRVPLTESSSPRKVAIASGAA